jgi:hypothetical protein
MRKILLAAVIVLNNAMLFSCSNKNRYKDESRLSNTPTSRLQENLFGMYEGYGAEAIKRTVRLKFQTAKYGTNFHVGTGFILNDNTIVTSYHGPESFLRIFDLRTDATFSFATQLDASLIDIRLVIEDSLKEEVLTLDLDYKKFIKGIDESVLLKSPVSIGSVAAGLEQDIHRVAFLEFPHHSFRQLLEFDRPLSPVLIDPNPAFAGRTLYTLSYRKTEAISPIKYSRLDVNSSFNFAAEGRFQGMYRRPSLNPQSLNDLNSTSLGAPLLDISEDGIKLLGVKQSIIGQVNALGKETGLKFEAYNSFLPSFTYSGIREWGYPMLEVRACQPR